MLYIGDTQDITNIFINSAVSQLQRKLVLPAQVMNYILGCVILRRMLLHAQNFIREFRFIRVYEIYFQMKGNVFRRPGETRRETVEKK